MVSGEEDDIPATWQLFCQSVVTFIVIFFNITELCLILWVPALRMFKATRFVTSLAVADLLMGCVVMTMALLHDLSRKTGVDYLDINSDKWCLAWSVSAVAITSASALNVCMVAVDRFVCIYKPLAYPRIMSTLTVNASIAGIWILSCIIAVSPLLTSDPPIGYSLFLPKGRTECEKHWVYSDSTFLIIVIIFVTCFIVAYVYTRIYVLTLSRIRSRVKHTHMSNNVVEWIKWTGIADRPVQGPAYIDDEAQVAQSQQESILSVSNVYWTSTGTSTPGRLTMVSDVSIDGDNGNGTFKQPPPCCRMFSILCCCSPLTASERTSSLFHVHMSVFRDRMKATAILSLLVLSYLTMWLPYGVLKTFFKNESADTTGKIDHVVLWMVYSNSGLNPILYFLLNMVFRRVLRERFNSRMHEIEIKSSSRSDSCAAPEEVQATGQTVGEQSETSKDSDDKDEKSRSTTTRSKRKSITSRIARLLGIGSESDKTTKDLDKTDCSSPI